MQPLLSRGSCVAVATELLPGVNVHRAGNQVVVHFGLPSTPQPLSWTVSTPAPLTPVAPAAARTPRPQFGGHAVSTPAPLTPVAFAAASTPRTQFGGHAVSTPAPLTPVAFAAASTPRPQLRGHAVSTPAPLTPVAFAAASTPRPQFGVLAGTKPAPLSPMTSAPAATPHAEVPRDDSVVSDAEGLRDEAVASDAEAPRDDSVASDAEVPCHDAVARDADVPCHDAAASDAQVPCDDPLHRGVAEVDELERTLRGGYVIFLKKPFVSWVLDGTKTMEVRGWNIKHRGRVYVVESASGRHCIGHVTVAKTIKIRTKHVAMQFRALHLLDSEYFTHKVFPLYGWMLEAPTRLSKPLLLDIKRGVVRSTWLQSEAIATYENNERAQHAEPQPTSAPPAPRRRIVGKTAPPSELAAPPSVQQNVVPPESQAHKRSQCESVSAEQPKKRARGRPTKSSSPEEFDPVEAAALDTSNVGGNRKAGLSIAAKWALVKEFLELSADPSICNANSEMLRRKRRGYYSGLFWCLMR